MTRSTMGRALLALAFCFLSVPTLAQEFRADLAEDGQVGKIHVKGEKYRLERAQSSEVFVVTDLEANVCRVFLSEEKKYVEFATDDFQVMSNDPFLAARYLATEYDVTSQGTEEVSGYTCEKTLISSRGQEIQTQWTSKELGFLLKTYQKQGSREMTMVLENIVVGPQPDDLFTIPAGFEQMEDPREARRRLVREMEEKEAAMPVLTEVGSEVVPCRARVGTGGELRVPVDTDRNVRLVVRARGEGPAEVTALPFRDGSQVSSIGVSPWQLDAGRSRDKNYNDSFFSKGAFTVDELRIQVTKGTVFVVVEQSGPFRKDQLNSGNTTRQFDVLLGRKAKLEVTGANPYGDETKGTLMLETEGGGEPEIVEFTVETGKTETWEFPAEKRLAQVQVSIKFAEGAARIALSQPTPKEIDVQELALPTGKTKCWVDIDRPVKLTMTAGGEPVKGKIRLERADRFSSDLELDLAAGETKTWTVGLDKKAVSIGFELSSGTATVVVGQSGSSGSTRSRTLRSSAATSSSEASPIQPGSLTSIGRDGPKSSVATELRPTPCSPS